MIKPVSESFVLGYLSGGTIETAFHQSVVELITGNMDYGGYINISTGPCLCLARNLLVQEFLKIERSDRCWLLMVDTDMILPQDIFKRLRARASETRVVGALCFCYDVGSRQSRPVMFGENLKPIYEWEDGALVPVTATGCACMLIHRSVLERVPGPWFVQALDGSYGEDQGACLKWAQFGVEICVDTSVCVEHVKKIYVGERDYREHRARMALIQQVPVACSG